MGAGSSVLSSITIADGTVDASEAAQIKKAIGYPAAGGPIAVDEWITSEGGKEELETLRRLAVGALKQLDAQDSLHVDAAKAAKTKPAKTKDQAADASADDYLSLARECERAERYDDMLEATKTYMQKHKDDESIIDEARSLLSTACRNAAGQRRGALRAVRGDEALTKENGEESCALVKEFAAKVQKELKDMIVDVTTMIKARAFSEKSGEETLFFLKNWADLHRYRAEMDGDEDAVKAATEGYQKARKMAQESLEPTDPLSLGISLNYSVCLREIVKDQKMACEVAKAAFHEAIAKLDSLQEAQYKDATLIMQILRDNMTLWTVEEEDPSGR